MKLSEHFSLAEMLASQTATRNDFFEQFLPSPEVVQNLAALCVNVLEPIRIELHVPIRVSSGYRCERLNKYIGGAKFSQHINGQAADIQAVGVSNLELLNRIIALKLPYDQLICEFPDRNGEPAWIHVSHSDLNRRQVLQANRKGGRTYYTPYIQQ